MQLITKEDIHIHFEFLLAFSVPRTSVTLAVTQILPTEPLEPDRGVAEDIL